MFSWVLGFADFLGLGWVGVPWNLAVRRVVFFVLGFSGGLSGFCGVLGSGFAVCWFCVWMCWWYKVLVIGLGWLYRFLGWVLIRCFLFGVVVLTMGLAGFCVVLVGFGSLL